MARIADHPLRIARLKAGLSQLELAKRAGVQRSAVSAIEDGRTRRPTERLIGTLANHLGMAAQELEQEISTWLQKPLNPNLRPAAENLMLIPPYTLQQYYRSFSQWRAEIAPTQTAFASMLRMNPAIVRDYESGKLQSMPDGLSAKLMQAFKLSPEYLVALEGLPRA
jgi:transcriptional regulator with XRE-family HTH domain